MSVPPDLMQLIAGGGGTAGGAPPQPQGLPGVDSPVGGPMSTPQPATGDIQAAMVNLSIAMDLMENSLPAFGSESPEGAVILRALSSMSGKFGSARSKSKDLIPAELQQLMEGMKPNPVQAAMAGAGGPPPGMPPGMPPQMPMGMPPGMVQ